MIKARTSSSPVAGSTVSSCSLISFFLSYFHAHLKEANQGTAQHDGCESIWLSFQVLPSYTYHPAP